MRRFREFLIIFRLVEKEKPWTPRIVGGEVGFGVGTPEQMADVMEK